MGKSANIKNKRRRGSVSRRRVQRVIYTILSVAAILTVVIGSVSIFFKITAVTVTGETRYGVDAIRRASGLEGGGNLFTINKYAIDYQIRDNRPYIDQLKITRHLPGTVEIYVSDSVPVACIASGEENWLIDVDGKLLEEIGESLTPAEGLPRITGVKLLNPVAGQAFAAEEEDKNKPLLDILHTAKTGDILEKINRIELERLYQITLLFDGRFTVNIGTSDDLERKFKFLVYVASQLEPADRGFLDITDAKTVRFVSEA